MSATTSLRVGIDLVMVRRIAESLDTFGERFLRRVFTAGEIAWATSDPAEIAERLAARFAAKEATIKAIGMVDHPMSWRDIEVVRTPSGDCALALHGGARDAAALRGIDEMAVSMSHDGDFATAVVIARSKTTPEP